MARNSTPFRPETREWAVRIVMAQPKNRTRRREAIADMAAKVGCRPDTLRGWVRKAERAGGVKPGLFQNPRQRLRELESEVAALRRANELLRRELSARSREG